MHPSIGKFLGHLGKSFINLVYPPFCLHCEDSLDGETMLFCKLCLQMLTLIDPKERCRYCFSDEIDHQKETYCVACRRQASILNGMACAFDYEGPAATLIKRLKYGGLPYLANGAAAFLVTQFVRLDWPMPDYIVPVPMDPLKRWDRGYNQSTLLAQAFAQMAGCSVKEVLRRRKGSFSQAGLSYKQRMELKTDIFYAIDTDLLHDKCILIIDDVMTTGSTLRCCAEALCGLHPQSIYALSVCRAL